MPGPQRREFFFERLVLLRKTSVVRWVWALLLRGREVLLSSLLLSLALLPALVARVAPRLERRVLRQRGMRVKYR